MAGMSGAGGMGGLGGGGGGLLGGGQKQQGPAMAQGSPAATEADVYQLQQQQQAGASPIFGGNAGQGQGAADTGDMSQRAALLRQWLGSQQAAGQGGAAGGPTRVRRGAQPVMGA